MMYTNVYRHFWEILIYMSDMRFLDREDKKKQLRSNIVPRPQTGGADKPGLFSGAKRAGSGANPGGDRRPGTEEFEEDGEEVIRQVQKKRRKRRLVIGLAAVVLIGALAFSWYHYQKEYEYTDYTVAWEKAMRYESGNNGTADGGAGAGNSGGEGAAAGENSETDAADGGNGSVAGTDVQPDGENGGNSAADGDNGDGTGAQSDGNNGETGAADGGSAAETGAQPDGNNGETGADGSKAAADGTAADGTAGTDGETAAPGDAAGESSVSGGNEGAAANSGSLGQGVTAPAPISVSDSSFVNFAYFGENMIKYTKDGATYIDASGKDIWTQGYEMKTPVITVNGDCAVIADQQGNDMYIFNTQGCTGIAKTQLPITKAAVSAKGVAAALVEDSTAAYIFYYKKDGDTLGIDIKMLLSGDGYPVDLALSPDGQQIVMSVMYLKNGVLKNKVVFYDFSEIGKNVNNRFVGGFEKEFDDKLAARVRYLNNDTVCAFSDKGLTFISVKNVIPDPNVVSVPVGENIESICYSDQYAGVVVENSSGDPYRLDLYRTDGTKASSIDFDYTYSGVKIDGDRVILYNEESCRVFDIDGHEKFNGQFDFPVSCVRTGKNHLNSLIVAGSEVMKEIRLK